VVQEPAFAFQHFYNTDWIDAWCDYGVLLVWDDPDNPAPTSKFIPAGSAKVKIFADGSFVAAGENWTITGEGEGFASAINGAPAYGGASAQPKCPIRLDNGFPWPSWSDSKAWVMPPIAGTMPISATTGWVRARAYCWSSWDDKAAASVKATVEIEAKVAPAP
jgi:hypothetical protein